MPGRSSDTALSAPERDATAIRARGVTKHFGDFVAIQELDLDVQSGECVGLLGPNGAGKSTFIGCLYGVVPYRADLLPFRRVLSADRSACSWRAGAVLTVLPWYALAPNGGVGARVSRGGRASRGASLSIRGRSGWMGIRKDPAKTYDLAFSPIDPFELYSAIRCISLSTRWKANRNLILLSTTNQKGALRSRSARRWRLPNIVWKEIK
jgi:energy-coupling factor transporter ATP-binding protein EcfA2